MNATEIMMASKAIPNSNGLVIYTQYMLQKLGDPHQWQYNLTLPFSRKFAQDHYTSVILICFRMIMDLTMKYI